MGITKYGVWVFFKDKKSAEKTAKELNTMMNRYGVFIMDKLKVLEDNSLKIFLARKDMVEEVAWKFNDIKYVWVDLGNGWKMDLAGSGLWDKGEKKLSDLYVATGDAKRGKDEFTKL